MLVGLGAQSFAGTAQSLAAKVLRIRGMARYSSDHKTWQIVKVGTILKPGSVIQTAEKAVVDIRLGERVKPAEKPTLNNGKLYEPEEETANIVRIFESSVVGIDKLTAQQTGMDSVEETQLDLRAGRIMGNVKKLASASKYEVKFPKGTITVRGTLYMLNASGVVNVLNGAIVISWTMPDNSLATKLVSSGHRFDPNTGEMTEIPVGPIPSGPPEEPSSAPPVLYMHDHTLIHVSPIHDE